MFTSLLECLETNSTYENVLGLIINPFSPYYICDYYLSDEAEIYNVPIPIHAKEFLKSPQAPVDGNIIYVQVNFIEWFCQYILPKLYVKIILITGQWHAPQHTNIKLSNIILNHPNIMRWYSQNPIFPNGGKYYAFPYGIEHTHLEKYARVLLESRSTLKTTNIASLPLNTSTNSCRQLFKITTPYLELSDFYREVARAKFLISPIGDRDDCYRHYEAIGLGTIPLSNVGPFYKHIFESSMMYFSTSELVEIADGKKQIDEYQKPRQELICLEYYKEQILQYKKCLQTQQYVQ